MNEKFENKLPSHDAFGMGEISNSDLTEKMSQWFNRFAEQTSGSPMYCFLSKEISKSVELLNLACKSDVSQPAPNLFLAAVNYLVTKNPTEELAKYYPNLGGSFEASQKMFTVFASFCKKYENQIINLIKARLVQTNEVQRCALLLPGLSVVSKLAGSPKIALIDVGASGGLNLLMDQAYVKYSNGMQTGPMNSSLQLECELKGATLHGFKNVVRIASRIGIDLNPVDLLNPNEREWAMALLWPDQPERLKRFKTALQLLSNTKILLHEGNANAVLPNVFTKIPHDQQICVMHSFTLNQFSESDRKNFDHILEMASVNRSIWRMSLEWIGTENPELVITEYSSGKRNNSKKLAECHGHGEWIRWMSI